MTASDALLLMCVVGALVLSITVTIAALIGGRGGNGRNVRARIPPSPNPITKYGDTMKATKRKFCNDCGIDVLAIGDWYMATSEIWEKQLGLGWNDNLCIACLQKRLGRKARFPADIWWVCGALTSVE